MYLKFMEIIINDALTQIQNSVLSEIRNFNQTV